MIQKIRETLMEKQGENLILKIDIGRNKYEVYEGILDNLYENIFTVNINGLKRSFSYSDVLTKNVILKFV